MLAANLITRLIVKHMEQNLAVQTASKASFQVMWQYYNTLEKNVEFQSIPFSWTWAPKGREH